MQVQRSFRFTYISARHATLSLFLFIFIFCFICIICSDWLFLQITNNYVNATLMLSCRSQLSFRFTYISARHATLSLFLCIFIFCFICIICSDWLFLQITNNYVNATLMLSCRSQLSFRFTYISARHATLSLFLCIFIFCFICIICSDWLFLQIPNNYVNATLMLSCRSNGLFDLLI